jgi:hypothetical protein
MSVDVCMETELTLWNDEPPSMATNDVVVGCGLFLKSLYSKLKEADGAMSSKTQTERKMHLKKLIIASIADEAAG